MGADNRPASRMSVNRVTGGLDVSDNGYEPPVRQEGCANYLSPGAVSLRFVVNPRPTIDPDEDRPQKPSRTAGSSRNLGWRSRTARRGRCRNTGATDVAVANIFADIA